MAKNAIGLAIATEEYGGKFFANGAAPSGVLAPSRIRAASGKAGSRPLADSTTVIRSLFWKRGLTTIRHLAYQEK